MSTLLSGNNLYEWLNRPGKFFNEVVQFNVAKEKLIPLDFTENNEALEKIDLGDTGMFCKYINELLQNADAKFGIGGYNELRTLYSRSTLFSGDSFEQEEPRKLHLGIDIWGEAGTEIYAPLNGKVHSFAFNDHFGDYGATIILQHQLEEVLFYSLYGHLSLDDINNINKGDTINNGQKFAHFGLPQENGHWPPHLHFQLIENIGDYKGDYPGVCKFSEREKYLANCPDPDLILRMMQFIK